MATAMLLWREMMDMTFSEKPQQPRDTFGEVKCITIFSVTKTTLRPVT